MASGSLRIREELVWEPDYEDEYYLPPSPLFLFMNLRWKLKICSYYDYVDHSSKLSYKIYLINQDERLPEPFKVSTFIEDRKSNVRLQCSTITISSIEESLYKVSADSIPELSILKQTTIRVRFFPSTGLAVREETENDAVQSTSVNFLRDIEVLSDDFINLMDNGFMDDVQVKRGECIIPAHNAVLAARSELLSTKLQDIEFQNVNAVMNFDDIEPAILCIFLRYLYSGKIVDDLSEGTLRELHKVSVMYNVPTLRKFCLNNMIRNLNRENVTKISDIHHECKNKEIKLDSGYEHENDNLKFSGDDSDIVYEREEEQKITAPDLGISYKRKDNARKVESFDVGLTYEHEDELTLLAPYSDVAYVHEDNGLEVTAADLDLAYERGDK